MRLVFLFICYFDNVVAMVDAGRRTDEDRALDAFGEREGICHHRVGFRHRCGIEDRKLREACECPRVLLGLARDGARVVCNHNDHAALDADILEAHERIRRDVEADLLHRDKHARPCIGSACAYLHRSLLVHRPFDVDMVGTPLHDGLDDLSGRRAGISRYHIHACRKGTQGQSLVAHKEFLVHAISLS